jgi:phospholipase/carboxylesterase
MTLPMKLPTTEFCTSPLPSASVILLHGMGNDGHDFIQHCRTLDLAAIGGVRFVLPHAPQRPLTIQGGALTTAWYDLIEVGWGAREDAAGLHAARQQVQALIALERARGVPAQRIVLAGYSMGSALAVFTALRHPERLAGVAGVSGYLPLASRTAAERDARHSDLPVFLCHGRRDDVVPFDWGTGMRDLLMGLGHPVDWHDYDGGHDLAAPALADLRRWLLTVLA